MQQVESGMVVCCPKCGATASVSKIGIENFACRKCSAKFGAWVVNGFAVVFENDGSDGEDDLRRFQKCQQKSRLRIAEPAKRSRPDRSNCFAGFFCVLRFVAHPEEG